MGSSSLSSLCGAAIVIVALVPIIVVRVMMVALIIVNAQVVLVIVTQVQVQVLPLLLCATGAGRGAERVVLDVANNWSTDLPVCHL